MKMSDVPAMTEIFCALCDQTRVRLLLTLRRGERNVTALCEQLPLSWSHYCLVIRLDEPFKRKAYKTKTGGTLFTPLMFPERQTVPPQPWCTDFEKTTRVLKNRERVSCLSGKRLWATSLSQIIPYQEAPEIFVAATWFCLGHRAEWCRRIAWHGTSLVLRILL